MSEYFSAVEDIAAEAMDEDDPEEFIWCSVDSSEWIIYTANTIVVLQESSNDSALFVEGLSLSDCSSFGGAMARMAFCAMHADVMEEYLRLQAEVEE